MIAIILGTGKSLNDFPRELLDKYPSYGSNYIGMAGIQPTYYACGDYRLLADYDGINVTARNAQVAYLSAVNLPAGDPIYSLPNVVILNHYFKDKKAFAGEKSMSGGTITYSMLKLAFYAGYNVAMWGVDFDPTWQHFRNDYPCPGNLDRKVEDMIYHMRLASEVYKKAGRKLVNFSLPSVLDEFIERCTLKEFEDACSIT